MRMTFIKTTMWAGASVFAKAISAFFISKIIAIYTGPVGLALIEQFQNFIQIVRTFSGSLIQQGVVKYVVEYRDNTAAKSAMLSSGVMICVISSLFLSLILCCFSTTLSEWMLQSAGYTTIIKLFALSLLFFSLNSLFLAVLNGELEVKKYVLCNLANTVLIFVLTLLAVKHYGLKGGLLTVVLNQSLICLLTGYFVMKSQWFRWTTFTRGLDKGSLTKLGTYAIIMIMTTLVVPLSQIIVRKYVAHSLSWEDAGYWQGIIKLSNNYQILIDSTFSLYFLPRFAQLVNPTDLKKMILHCYKYLFPMAVATACLVYCCRRNIILILYSKQFLPMMSLFKYQLIGDVARVSAWLLMYVMIAKTLVRGIIITEIAFFFVYTASTIYFVRAYGLIGTTIGFAVSYLFYWLSMSFFTAQHIYHESRIKTHKEMIPHVNFQALEESR